MYYVKGGVWDNNFEEVQQPEQYGPYTTYERALQEWRRRTFTQQLDNCFHRLEIVKENPNNPSAEIFISTPARYKHLKRGSTYSYIDEIEPEQYYKEGDAFLYHTPLALIDVMVQRSVSTEKGPLIIYMCEHSYKLWARPKDEFYDGRFEEIDKGS